MDNQDQNDYDVSDFEDAMRSSLFNQATTSVDQVSTIWEDIARGLGKYYKTLIANDIPQDLAAGMVSELHSLFWGSQFVPDVHIHRDDIL